MEEKQITYKLTDTGHWLARCDHSTNVIELNRRNFFKLSPMMQDYIWIHECVHLKYDVYDETECNRITDEIFISRAKNDSDRMERIKFVVSSHDSSKSNFWTMLVGSLISLGTSAATKAIVNGKTGYYSLDVDARRTYVDGLLAEAFKASLLTDTQSAKDIFWANLKPNIAKNKEQVYSGWRKNNGFVDEYIEKYEQMYNFGFDEITPINKKAHPEYQKMMNTIGAVAVVLAVIVLVVVLTKTKK
ncbi:MAG: hypothetical protein IJZ06_08015 [Bacteroidales bacterium]|nr:hypothetical protein [Bacteroidales bacterium]